MRVSIFLYLCTLVAALLEPINHPQLDWKLFGNSLGLFGDFDSISIYNYVNDSSIDTDSDTSKLFLRNLLNNSNLPIGQFDGAITQLLPVSEDTVLVLGNFTHFNDEDIQSPILYNLTGQEVTQIILQSSSKRDDLPSVNGTVNTVFIDNDLVYMGGDFVFNNTYSAAVYNMTSKQLSSLPFRGFGENSRINSIQKIFDESDNGVNSGSIVFGGQFNTLGFKDLLIHNITSNSTKNHTNTTNFTSVITAEQQISLKHGTFTTINGGKGDPKSLICPKNNDYWSVLAGEGGEWSVELPDAMNGLVPSKARLYIPDSPNSAKFFRIYTYPNNGIMNLSYIDPDSNQLSYCDAWCPLQTVNYLKNQTTHNLNNMNESNNVTNFIDESGSYISYYNASTKIRTLGYGNNYQEFAFKNPVGVDRVGVTIVDWYGDEGGLSGFELYSDSIQVYGNETLNAPNCDSDDDSSTKNAAEIIAGAWQSVKSLVNSVQNTDYMVSQDTNTEIIVYPNITYSGYYSFIMTTPGCIADNSCDRRSIVNVTLVDGEGQSLATKLIYQNNDYDKFDYLYYGHLNGSVEDLGKVRVEISRYDSITKNDATPWTVMDKVVANIVSLDHYFDVNSTNSTRNKTSSDYELTYIKLNGLFEYSLANFTNFNESKVVLLDGNVTKLNPENKYIGNSTINTLSGELANTSSIQKLEIAQSGKNRNLLILGNFQSDSNSLTLLNDNLITLSLTGSNTNRNDSQNIIVDKREEQPRLFKRDELSIYGATFNSPVENIFEFEDQVVFLGDFTIEGNGTKLFDLSNDNKTTTSISNIAFYSNKVWYGLGNNGSTAFDQMTNVTIDNNKYIVFSQSAANSTYETWDSTNNKWVTDPKYQLKINQAVSLDETQQILGGQSFKIMDNYGVDQAFVRNDSMTSYDFNVTDDSNYISRSYYINETLSVIGGSFKTNSSITNVGFLRNGTSTSLIPLQGDISWGPSTEVETLFVNSGEQALFIGMNGPIAVNNANYTGVVIYDLLNNKFEDIQPPSLSNDDGSPIEVNAIVQYDKGGKLLVGGKFTKAGSFDCNGLCIYDLNATRWIDPSANSSGLSVSGTTTDIRFFEKSQVFISGNFTIGGDHVNFVTYDFGNENFDKIASLDSLGSDKAVKKFLIQDSNINTKMIAYGANFISGFDGSNWQRIDQEIVFGSDTIFNDIKLLDLAKANANGTYFGSKHILALAGRFELKKYGLVNVALFNGSNWTPYIYSETTNGSIGEVKSLLINDKFGFLSSEDVKTKSKLSNGKVVGISLACALGSTTLLGLLYLIPFYLLLRKQNDGHQFQRINEKDQLNAVNPEDLLEEIDIQRHR
jgi:hypothetical protein